jgi:hypothetical protein
MSLQPNEWIMGIPAVWFDAEVIYLLSLTANNLNILNNLRWINIVLIN